MRKIKLTQGFYALVDDNDYEELNQYNWHYAKQKDIGGYAVRTIYLGGGRKNAKCRSIMMHRVIMAPPKGLFIDHINHDKLDNRRSNLRICTRAQNGANQNIRKNNKSGYKGVYWDKRRNTWIAQTSHDGRVIRFKYSKDIKAAVKAYDEGMKQLFGEFAKPNGI